MKEAQTTAEVGNRKEVSSVCYMCYSACQINVQVEGGVVTRIMGRPEGFNRGVLCPKGNAGIMQLYDRNRVRTPLKRTNPQKGIAIDPGFVEITWEEALATLIEKLRELREENPEGLAISNMDPLRQLPYAAFAHAFGAPFAIKGSSSGISCGNGMHVLARHIHGGWLEHVDYNYCNYLLQLGGNQAFEAYTGLGVDGQDCADARVRGMRLVVVDPRLSAAAAKATEWVPIRPGTDGALVMGMIHTLIHELGRYDADFIKECTNGPYLIGPEGYYVREKGTGKPLVWDLTAGRPCSYDDPGIGDYALEGEYVVQGTTCKPAFHLLKERAWAFPPERVAAMTTVPPDTIRRLAREWAEAASMGATIRLGAEDFPLRPVAVNFYRGTLAHKHSSAQTLAFMTLAMIMGAIDVPGAMIKRDASLPLLGRAVSHQTGRDGCVLPDWEPREVAYTYPPKSTDLREWFPFARSLGLVHYLTTSEPDKYALGEKRLAMLIRQNPLFTLANPPLMVESFQKSFNVVCDVVLSETTELADIFLPDGTYLERYAMTGPPHPTYWSGRILAQPAVPPLGGVPDFVDVLIELADRLGILYGPGGMNFWFNTLMEAREPYLLDLNKRYTWRDVIDHSLQSFTQGHHSLEWFRSNGQVLQKAETKKYTRYHPRMRLALYVEELKKVGDTLRQELEKHGVQEKLGIQWDLSDYDPLPNWRPGPEHEAPPEYDMFAVSYKSVLGIQGAGANNPWLMELMEKDPYLLKLWMNRETARRKGIREGDPVWVESPVGRVRGIATLSESIHPECVGFGSIFGHWAKHSVAQGKGSHFNSLCSLSLDHMDFVVGAVENACVRVKVIPVKN